MATSSNMSATDESKENAENLVADLEKKIAEAFDIFDYESNGTVDVREMGTIVRSLGCCPTEAELRDLLSQVEEDEPTGHVRFEKFRPTMVRVILERRYRPTPEDTLLKAFEKLDSENKGYLTKEEITKYLTEEGEGFEQDELAEMFSAAADPDTGNIFYKEFVPQMVVEDPLF